MFNSTALAALRDEAKNNGSATVEYLGAHYGAVSDAVAYLNAAEHLYDKLRKALKVYADPTFYDELPPSKALEDRGQHARNVLNETDDDDNPATV